VLHEQGLPAELIPERWTLYSGHVTHALADRELLAEIAPTRITTSREAFLSHLTDTAVSVALAPTTPISVPKRADRRRTA